MNEEKTLLKKYLLKWIILLISTLFVAAGLFILVNKIFSEGGISLPYMILIILASGYLSIKSYLDVKYNSIIAIRLRELNPNLYRKIVFLEFVFGIILLIFFISFRMFYGI